MPDTPKLTPTGRDVLVGLYRGRDGLAFRLTPGRIALLRGLYEGRVLTINIFKYRQTWADDPDSYIGNSAVRWATKEGLIAWAPGDVRVLTPAGRALAERIAQEGR